MSDDRIDGVAMHRAYWPETFDERYLPFVFNLLRAHEAHIRRTEAVIARYGLSPGELDVLATLRRSPSPWVMTPSELRRSMFITSGGLAKILRQLEARGLVSRRTDSADRRVKPVQLTPAAKPIVEAAVTDIVASGGERLRAILSEAEIAEVTAILAKLVDG